MKFIAQKNTFSSALFKIQGVITQKTTLTILSNVLIEAVEDGTVNLYATDLDVTIFSRFKADVTTPGTLLLAGKYLFDIVKSASGSTITIESLENNWAKVTAGNNNAKVVGIHPDEYPHLPQTEGVELYPIDTRVWIDMIEKTIFSISTDEGRANLTGAFLHWTGEQLEMVSTDGHRLSKIEVNIEDLKLSDSVPEQLSKGVIIPRKGLHELRRTLSPSEESLRFGIHKNNIVFDYTDTRFIARLIEGTYPDFSQVLPNEAENKARIPKAPFQEVLKRIALFANPKTNNVQMSLDRDSIELSATDPEKGEGRESLPIEYEGKQAKAGYNHRYLIDILNVLSQDEFLLEVTDTVSPTIIRDPKNDKMLFIVMPMRI